MHLPWIKNLIKAESVYSASVSSYLLTKVLNAYLTSFQTLSWLSYGYRFAVHINCYTLMEFCVHAFEMRTLITYRRVDLPAYF